MLLRNTLMALVILIPLGLAACTPASITPTPPSPATATPTPPPTPSLTSSPTTPPKLSPTATPTATPAPSATPTVYAPIFYTVQVGDTLGGIANQFGVDTMGLARANHIDNIDLIYVDQVLLIDIIPVTVPQPTVTKGKQIVVVLSTQRTYSFEDGILLKEFIVSTGTWNRPTVTGEYEIYEKHEFDDMSGGVKGVDYYYLADVPWTMYFHKGYGFHGTYWHHNFGVPMSHGCVNMYTPDAEWLYAWAPIGTPVLILP